ncbi:MAG TPA: hypothetical protein PKA64_02995 [Myxococcota bacterium]|nr:hypothetical protein [Myxococcota bacterium]
MSVTRWLLLGLLAGVPEIAVAQTTLVEQTDRLGENAVAEAEAARVLISAVQDAILAGALQMPTEAGEQFARAAEQWKEVRRLALERDFGGAYRLARRARPDLRTSLYEALGGKPPVAVTDAVRAYIDVTGPRLQAIERQIVNYPLSDDGRMNQHLGEAHWAEALKASKKKDWSLAFRLLMEALGELDLTLVECYPAAR